MVHLALERTLYKIGSGVFSNFISRTHNNDLDILGVNQISCDISDSTALINTLKKINELDYLVNIAGPNLCENINNIDVEEWDRVLNTNLRSFFITIKYCIEKTCSGGKIVNVSSIAGRSKSLVSGVHYLSKLE